MVRHPVVATDPAPDSLEELAAVEALPTIQPEAPDSEEDVSERSERDSSAALTVPCDPRASDPQPKPALELTSQNSTPDADLVPAAPETSEPMSAASAAEEIPAAAVTDAAPASVEGQPKPPPLPAVESGQETLPAAAAFAKTELALQAPAALVDAEPGLALGSQAMEPVEESIEIPGLEKGPIRLGVLLPVLAVVIAVCGGVLFLTMRGGDSPQARVAPHSAKKVPAKTAPKPTAPPKTPTAPPQTKAKKASAVSQTQPEPPKVTVQEPEVEGQPESKPQTQPAEVDQPAEKQQAGAQDIPASLHAPLVLHRVHMALHQARKCNPKGHAVGTSDVFVTFGPDGRVSDAQVVGGDLMGKPVAKCIVLYARSVRIPTFEGEPFTVKESITLH